MTEVVAKEVAAEVDVLLGRLLGLKRLCAQVHPIIHEVKRENPKTGKVRTKKEPTGDFLVRLFEGGHLFVINVRATEEAITFADGVNKRLAALARAALEPDRQLFCRTLANSAGVDGLKKARATLANLRAATGFALAFQGETLVVANPTTEIRFAGADAHVRATKFCTAVNKYLADLCDPAEKQLRASIATLVERL